MFTTHKNTKSSKTRGPAVLEHLEGRQLFAVTGFQMVGTELRVTCDAANDDIKIASSGIFLTVSDKGRVSSFLALLISSVRVTGNDGNDVIDASKSNVKVDLRGNAGRDSLIGSEKGDKFDGGTGVDVVYALGGDDYIEDFDLDNDIYIGGKGTDTWWSLNQVSGEDYLDSIEVEQTVYMA